MKLHHRHFQASAGGLSPVATGSRAVVLATALVVGSALLTACESSEADGTGTVTVGVAGNVFDVPLRVADAEGYFSKHGLKVEFVQVTAATGTPSLKSGTLQFLNSSPTSFLGGVAKGLPLVAVGVDGLGNPLGLVVSKEFAKRHALTAESPPGEVAKALEGSTGGFSSANTKAEAGIFLKAWEVDPKDVSWVSLPSPSADEAALGNGRIDWFLTSEPLPLQIQHAGGGVVVANSEKVVEWSSGYAGYGQVVVTDKNYASQHTATVKNFMAAVREGASYLVAHMDDPSVVAVAGKALPGVPAPVVKASIEEAEYPLFANMNAHDWRETFHFVDELGGLPEDAEITTGDWTNAYLG
ncbi:ABC transporter substrate-binding protein [Streptomyces sp. NPDC102451]|uniref:ABC transporter substrate-binding protein n=1 Tax=Streptomyces sp. NPDC102451 TaxID=3366177 RepID=UPI0038023943